MKIIGWFIIFVSCAFIVVMTGVAIYQEKAGCTLRKRTPTEQTSCLRNRGFTSNRGGYNCDGPVCE